MCTLQHPVEHSLFHGHFDAKFGSRKVWFPVFSSYRCQSVKVVFFHDDKNTQSALTNSSSMHDKHKSYQQFGKSSISRLSGYVV